MIGLSGLVDLDGALVRPGQVACVCDPDAPDSGQLQASLVWRLATAFGLSVLAQALIVATLPIAAASIAPRASLAGWPLALTMLGAALASLPASFLLDVFGRRAAFGLGASLGIAGGLLIAWSIFERRFPGLCLGAFWLGMAQGFGLFYRHAAAQGAASRARAAVFVFGGGVIAALAAPGLMAVASQLGGPLVAVTAAGAAALAWLLALPLCLSLPHAVASDLAGQKVARTDWWRLGLATLVGAAAWFGMAGAMSAGPGMLAGCGATAATIGGVISLHLLAMYAPSALAGGLLARLPVAALAAGGLVLVALGLGGPMLASVELTETGTGLVVAGLGWALANAGALRLLHGETPQPTAALALHDVALLLAALAGAVLV